MSLSRTRYLWVLTYLSDISELDLVWEPPPWQAHQRHAWPSQWQRDSGVYLVPKQGFTDTNYHDSPQVRVMPDLSAWTIPDYVVDWDTSWHPDASDPPLCYHFATQWQPQGGPEYRVPGATQVKYLTQPQAQTQSRPQLFQQLQPSEFAFNWHPHPFDPPFRYVFGNQWWPAERMPTIEYCVPGATSIKYMSYPKAQLRANPAAPWQEILDCEWDQSWCPDPGDPPYIYVFGNQWWPAEVMPTLRYHVAGATEIKYVDFPRATLKPDGTHWIIPDGIDPDSVDMSWKPNPGSPAYIYQFGTQWQKTGGAVYHVPGASQIKYVSAFRCHKTSRDPYWTVPSVVANALENFDWTWHPDDTEQAYIYEFGTQHQKTGGPEYHVPGAHDRKYVTQVLAQVKHSRAVAVVIDHMDGNSFAVHEQVSRTVSVIKTVRYVSNYLDTLRRIAAQIDQEWIWIVSSVCDYAQFDFTWYPEQWQSTMLHVFASDDLKFGDTFFMHAPTFRDRATTTKLLEWYDVNFVERAVPRRPVAVVEHQADSHVEVIQQHHTKSPVTLFTVSGVPAHIPPVNLWRPDVKDVIPLDAGATRVLIPREAIAATKTQVYDYAYINKQHRDDYACSPMDIVFVSNGEPNADENFERLLQVTGSRYRVHRVKDVPGRARAHHACAEVSTTPWYFLVPAKLWVDQDFDWSWQPDRLQIPKHYIFHAHNPVTNLEYGHMAMIAFNKRMALNNPGSGLDFAMDQEHDVIPLMSGQARYNVDAWTAWRTAFREVIKLRFDHDNIESQYRLKKWLQPSAAEFADWSQHGANDALHYFDQVKGDLQALRKSYEWDWCRDWFKSRHRGHVL